jgi:hypothetical protein
MRPQADRTSSPGAATVTRRNAVGSSLVIAAWIAITALLVEPLQAAWLDWDELAIDLPTLIQRLAPIAIVTSLVLSAIGAALSGVAPTRGLALWTALEVAVWAQADLFVWQYGTFDGTPIDWSIHQDKS